MFDFTTEVLDNFMSFEDFQEHTQRIVDKELVVPPYDNEAYHSFTASNHKRIGKILNQIQIEKKLYNLLNEGIEDWTWIVFNEPWCGDAAFSVPVLYAMTLASGGAIDFKIALRDTHPQIMEHYLTNGGQAIPKMVCLDKNNQELGTWGPRPNPLQDLSLRWKEEGIPVEEKIKASHQWYHKDKHQTIQAEMIALIKKWKNV